MFQLGVGILHGCQLLFHQELVWFAQGEGKEP